MTSDNCRKSVEQTNIDQTFIWAYQHYCVFFMCVMWCLQRVAGSLSLGLENTTKQVPHWCQLRWLPSNTNNAMIFHLFHLIIYESLSNTLKNIPQAGMESVSTPSLPAWQALPWQTRLSLGPRTRRQPLTITCDLVISWSSLLGSKLSSSVAIAWWLTVTLIDRSIDSVCSSWIKQIERKSHKLVILTWTQKSSP